MPAVAVGTQILSGGFRPSDGTGIFGSIYIQVEGVHGQFGGNVIIPYGLSVPQIAGLVRDAAVTMISDQGGPAIAPEDTVQIFGLPVPTLVDLGG